MKWERVQLPTQQTQVGQGLPFNEVISTSGPGKRWGHTCNAIKGGRFLYVFGGYGKDNCQTNEVHVFDTVNQTWSQPVIKGIPPTARDSHTCTTVGDNLFVFGGTDGMRPLKDLHILDTSSLTWISPSVRGQGPDAREGHSAALVGKRLFIFGGCGKSSITNEEIYYNDLYILNTEIFVWKCAVTSGNPPSARDSHTCSSWKNKIIVIGGEDGHDYYLSDVHVLDTDTLVWKQLDAGGQMLPPRAGHATVALGKFLFVFGGFTDSQNLYDDLYMLDVESDYVSWIRISTTGERPTARFSIAGDSLDPLKSGVIVFIGGCNKSLEALDDMYYLYTGIPGERKLEKLSLRKQLKLKCQEQNLTSGHDRSVVRVKTTADVPQPVPLASYGQPRRDSIPSYEPVNSQGKPTFCANVTENLSHGFTIEAVVDGKPLRGVLFAKTPSPVIPTNINPSRKRAAEETAGVMLNGDCGSDLRDSKTLVTEVVEQQGDGIHGKEFAPHEMAATTTPATNSPAAPNAIQPVKDSVDPEPSAATLNVTDDQTNAAPCSTTELPKEMISLSEANPASLTSINQGDKTSASEGQGDLEKSVS